MNNKKYKIDKIKIITGCLAVGKTKGSDKQIAEDIYCLTKFYEGTGDIKKLDAIAEIFNSSLISVDADYIDIGTREYEGCFNGYYVRFDMPKSIRGFLHNRASEIKFQQDKRYEKLKKDIEELSK